MLPYLLLDHVAPSTDDTTPPRAIGFAAPILPGKAETDRAYLASLRNGDGSAEYAASRQRAGITSEMVSHQETPDGVLAVGYMEAHDPEAAMDVLATSDEPFDRYFRDQVREVHGFDFEDGFPPREQIFDWSASSA